MRGRLLVAPLAAALLTAPTAAAAVRTGDESFRSNALDGDLHYLIQLPAGYTTSHARYPVVYFLHGLPAGPDAYKSVAWVGQVLAKERKPAILVVPQGTRRKNGDPEYHDWPATTGRPRSRSTCRAGSTTTTLRSRTAAAGRSSASPPAATAPPAWASAIRQCSP